MYQLTLILFVIFFTVAFRVGVYFLDKEKIYTAAKAKGWVDIEVHWVPFVGFLNRSNERNYRVLYTDDVKNRCQVICKTLLMNEVFWGETVCYPAPLLINTACVKPTRSSFINATAFIMLGLAIPIGLMLYRVLLDFSFFTNGVDYENPSVPSFTLFMYRHSSVIAMGLPLSIIATAYALWLRKNWARILFIIFFAFGIVFITVGSVMGFILMATSPFVYHKPQILDSAYGLVMLCILVPAIGFCLLSGWLISKLNSTATKLEFKANQKLD